jgi:hypothetical protein
MFVAALLLSSVVFSCGGGGGGSTPPPTTGSFKLTNSSGFTIDEVYVALSSDSSWGAIQNSSTIPSGSSWTLTNITPDTYDMRAVVNGAYSTYFTYATGFAITAGATHSITTNLSGFTGSLILTNTNATYSITAVYVSPASSGTWGANQISSSIAPSATRQIIDIPPGSYDVRIYRNAAYTYSYGILIGSIAYTNLTL